MDYISGLSALARCVERGERLHSMLAAAASRRNPASAEGEEGIVEEEVLRRVLLEISKSAQLPLEKEAFGRSKKTNHRKALPCVDL